MIFLVIAVYLVFLISLKFRQMDGSSYPEIFTYERTSLTCQITLHNVTFGKTVEVPRVILHTDTLIQPIYLHAVMIFLGCPN